MDMRLGKTLVTIRALSQRTNVHLVLVVAPYSALAGWGDDLNKEENYQWLNILGTKAERLKLLEPYTKPKNIVGQTYIFVNKEYHELILHKIPFDAIALDESTFIKNPRAKVTKFWLSFPRRPHQIRACLTGTPAPESELDFHCQLQFLGLARYKNYWEFRAKCFYPVGFDFVMRQSAKAELSRLLAGNAVMLKRKQLKLGGIKVREQRSCVLPPAMKKIYKTAEKEFILEIENMEINRTVFAGVKYQWLRQITGGFINRQLMSDHKFAILQELLNGELKNEQIVIWAQYIHEVLFISKKLNCPCVYGAVTPTNRAAISDEFQKGIHRLLVCQPETMKFGVRLDAAQTMIYYSTTESALTREQTEDRIIDVSKNDNVLIIDLVTENTVDESIQRSLVMKETAQETIRRMISEMRKR
jgi:SNF2 family DNA or RNA helicase